MTVLDWWEWVGTGAQSLAEWAEAVLQSLDDPPIRTALRSLEWVLVAYFCALNGMYLLLEVISVWAIRRSMTGLDREENVRNHPTLEPPISVIVPAYNEELTITASVRSLLQMEYSEFDVIVVNDGSQDDTLEVLIRDFHLYRFPEVYHQQLPTAQVRAIYRSRRFPNLKVIDKENGGKADGLNAGINCSIYPLFCGVDADSILQRDSLRRIVRPFMEDSRTVAAGGTIRIANGCTVRQGFIERVGLSHSLLPLLQNVEYLRAFFFGRLGWVPLNAVLIISGAFGVFHRQTVIEAGGYRRGTIGEDMDLVVRLHRHLRARRQPYRIAFLPDPVCWTEVPEDLGTLRNQRVRWQRGLLESLSANWRLCLNFRGGTVGWLAFPYFVVFEGFGPILEVIGYVYTVIALALGIASWSYALAFLTAVIGLSVFVTLLAVLIDDLLFQTYRQPSALLILPAMAILESLGYRQINTWWRIVGIWQWARGKKAQWGVMQRKAAWRTD